MGGSSNLPRLVTYAENPEIVPRLEEYCRQNRCSKSQGISRLLEQALGLSNSAIVALPSTAIAQEGTENSTASASKLEALERENSSLKKENGNLKAIVNELVPSQSTACATVESTANSTASAINSTASAVEEGTCCATKEKEANKKLNRIENQINKLTDAVYKGFEKLYQEHKEIADYIQKNLVEFEPETTQEENFEEIQKLREELEQERNRANVFQELWYLLFPNPLNWKDIVSLDNCEKAWVKTARTREEIYRIFRLKV